MNHLLEQKKKERRKIMNPNTNLNGSGNTTLREKAIAKETVRFEINLLVFRSEMCVVSNAINGATLIQVTSVHLVDSIDHLIVYKISLDPI